MSCLIRHLDFCAICFLWTCFSFLIKIGNLSFLYQKFEGGLLCFPINMQQGSLYVFGLSRKCIFGPTYLLLFLSPCCWSFWRLSQQLVRVLTLLYLTLPYSHLKGKKQQEISKLSCTNSITSLLKDPSETENKSQDNIPQTSKKQALIDNLMTINATTMAEIKWVLNMVCSRYSKNSSSEVNGLFAAMSPDSEIAKNFQCDSTKVSYITTYGLASFSRNLLLQKISSSPHQEVSFDESLNNSV